MSAVVIFITITIVPFVVGLWDAFVVAKMWNWFAAAPFSIAQMTTLQAYGLVMMISVLRHKPTPPSDSTPMNTVAERQAVLQRALRAVVRGMWDRSCASLTALGIAALVHMWMVR